MRIENVRETLTIVNADISGSSIKNVGAEGVSFQCCNLAGATFNDINFTGMAISDANLTGIFIDGAQWGGAQFKHIGYGDKNRSEDGHTTAKLPVRIISCNLEDAVVRETNLRGVSIEGCDIEGLTIDGVDIATLLRQHKMALNQ
ncbi:pentapeptide repeat-containing protein [Paenibacillus sp. UMB4589-SE434]|uniref:pentapeptide repeat-containing protein n=1 Tax=Paenibacillus sp. UMB4589-SE434 TaxID=3046314 RepID=UPI00254DADBC|nr:pentapeptide repeat-containing protein [Paenibacillus sp. UMB4589-SE434]MDK8179587.1 pentapeptide repeat-containing protein [Paenibacillus sp. UMB4589-SE434]